MSNSKLVSHINISPNKTKPRKYPISRITIHCVVGQTTVEALGTLFAATARHASSNYGIGKDGRVGMYVEECDRSWCSSSSANDDRAITIETASDTKYPYAVKDAAYSALLDLCTDICERNGKKKLLWFGDKEKTLAYKPADDEMVLTVHRWFASTECPGEYLYSRQGEIAAEVTRRLSGANEKPAVKPAEPEKPVCTVKEWQLAAIADGFQFPKYGADGVWGAECESVARKAIVKKRTTYTNKNLTKLVQNAVGVTVDGLCGAKTDAAIRAYQSKHGLTPDGAVGLNTWKKILNI